MPESFRDETCATPDKMDDKRRGFVRCWSGRVLVLVARSVRVFAKKYLCQFFSIPTLPQLPPSPSSISPQGGEV